MYSTKRPGSYSGLPRNKTLKAIGRKKMKHTNKSNLPSQSPPNPRTDEDSGLGGDSSFDGEPSLEPTPVRTNSSHSIPRNIANKAVSGVMFPTFGVMEQIFVDTGILSQKRPRLDMTEEANELPEEEISSMRRSEASPKIVSFKNVPELILPANAVQVQPTTTLLSLSHHQPAQPKPCAVEHLIKPKLVSAVKVGGKFDKPSKKKGKTHLLEGNLPSKSSNGAYELQLLTQPEGQHRARYQTEGSRGAVKDRAGTGHPCVKLKGYEKSTVLQVFVASDGGSVSPHLFYQACKVSGKNSTPCKEEKVHGTTVLEILMLPERDMSISCDCVGILKERNVDVEQRLKSFVSRGKKKSTKCRLVFRTVVTLPSGTQEVLQVVSQPISCTQPPGVPEICRKSRSRCNVEGKEELFIIGKNFYKDTEVLFRSLSLSGEKVLWSYSSTPEKDYLQSNHLICEIPPYYDTSIKVEVEVQVIVVSCGKMSDPHTFTYLPLVPKKESQQDSAQLHPLPKGVSPNAVKLNQLYAESGGGLPLSSKDYFLLSNPLSAQSLIKNGGTNKERAIVHPVQVNRVLATVNPQVQTTSSLITKFPQKNANSNTFTTATILTPKPSPNSIPSNPSVVGSAVSSEALRGVDGVPQGKDKDTLENLIQMLKLLKTLPGSLQTPIVDLVADEILKQFKRENNSSGDREGETEKVSSQLSSIGNLSCLLGSRVQLAQKANNQKEGNNFVGQGNTFPLNDCQVNPSTKLYPLTKSELYTFRTGNELTSLEQHVTDSLSTAPPTFAAVTLQSAEGQGVSRGDTKVVYPVSTLMSKELNYIDNKSKSEFSNCGLSTSQNGVNVVRAICQPNPPMVLNVAVPDSQPKTGGNSNLITSSSQYFANLKEEKVVHSTEGDIAKINFVTALNPPQQNCVRVEHSVVTTSSPLVSVQNVTPNVGLTHSLFEDNFKLPHPVEGINPAQPSTQLRNERTINKVKVENLLHNSLPSSNQNPQLSKKMLSDTSYAMDESSTNANIDSSLALQMEDCDPLLSQANAVPSMTLNTTDTTMTDHTSDAASMIHCPSSISSSVSSEVSIAQLSENDLLNYINPTCFDNV